MLGRWKVLHAWFYLLVSVEGFHCCPCLSLKACDLISSPYQDSSSCFFLFAFLLLYMAAAPDAARIYFIQPLLSCNSKLPLVFSTAQPKAKHIMATEQYCLMEQLWNNNLGFSLCLTASVSDPFDPVFPGLENSLPALLGVCCMARAVQCFPLNLSSFSCSFAIRQPKGRCWICLRQQVANAGTVQPVHVQPCSSARNDGRMYSLLVEGSWSQNLKALHRRACAREY